MLTRTKKSTDSSVRIRRPLWKQLLSESITRLEDLGQWAYPKAHLQKIISQFPLRINSYYFSLIKSKGDPIFKQCVPDSEELDDKGLEDPLNEEELSPVPGLTHRYPDRVLFLVSNKCAVYCRFCNRRRKVGKKNMVTKDSIEKGILYIKRNKQIRDVLLSGGDPLLLETKVLGDILCRLREISHVEIIRIGTRAPCTLPQRITPKLVAMLKRFHPLYVVTHFNHPNEITHEAAVACGRLADAGIPLACQTVLLKGVNDDISTIKSLMQGLLRIRVRPYYLFQADLVKGTSHFWTPLSRGLEIIDALRGFTSGLCVPHFAIDLPGGGGKIALVPDHIVKKGDSWITVKNYLGNEYKYPIYE